MTERESTGPEEQVPESEKSGQELLQLIRDGEAMQAQLESQIEVMKKTNDPALDLANRNVNIVRESLEKLREKWAKKVNE